MNFASTSWFGWIPTNRGLLNFEFIGLPKELNSKNIIFESSKNKIKYSDLDISYLSDSYKFNSISFLKTNPEFPAVANIQFENKFASIEGSVEIIYKDYCKLISNFTCQLNGVVEFKGISHDIDSLGNYDTEIKSIIYVLVKTIIHGDAHHHQKIDVALPIMDNKFEPSVISESLLNYIKLVERNVKISKSCESVLRNENLVFEISGYLSYFNSFNLLFDNPKVKKDFKFSQSVFKSLKSTVAKRKNKAQFTSNFTTGAYTAFGIFITLNVLVNGLWGPTLPELFPSLTADLRLILLVISFIIIVAGYFLHFNCKLHAYYYYHQYNLFEFSKFIRKGNWQHIGLIGIFLRSLSIIFYCGFLYFSYSFIQKLN